MNSMVRNLVGVMLVIGIPVFVAAQLWSAYFDRVSDPAAFREFTVSAQGKADVKPDIATLHLSVLTEGGTSVQDLQKDNTDKMNKVISFVKSKGVKDEDVTTSSYSISPRYQYFDCSERPPVPMPTPAAGAPDIAVSEPAAKVCPPPQIVGYSISQSASVKVRDFSKVGELLSGATAQGANSVSGPSFDLDDPAVYEQTAREQAISRAKEKAENMARAGNFKLGKLISIDESSYAPEYYAGYGKGGMVDASAPTASPAPSIEAGTQRVTVDVRIRYEIK